MKKEFETKSERKYSVPTDYLRDQLIKALYEVTEKVAGYTDRGQIGKMRGIMIKMHPVYNYFRTYAEANSIKFSDRERRVMDKTNKYYSGYKHVKITPSEAKILLDLLTRLAYRSGLYNIHRLQSPEEEGI
ncbi:MAG: hypothetical protein ACOC80_09150 [Petrotogales bacterium]